MKSAYFRFYEELNDFLPPEKRKTRFEHVFSGSPSVKDVIESLGVPHTEIDLILVNSNPENFSYNINDKDEISVYPVFESFDISGIQHLRPKPLREPKFVLDVHLGSLAKYMRMAGFDTMYKNNFTEDELTGISLSEERTIITKDRALLKHTEVTHGYWLRNLKTEDQLKEVIKRFHLETVIRPFTRCMECNNLLNRVDKAEIAILLPAKVKQIQNDFRRCGNCGRIYWKGSHYEKMHNLIERLKGEL